MVKGFFHVALACCVSAVTVYGDGSDQNCQVTSWDPWEPCDPLTNTQTRHRYVQVTPTGNGYPCPELIETIDCFMNAFVLEAKSPLSLVLEANAISPPAISTFNDQTGARADGIAAVKGQITNNPRQVMVGGNAYPYFYGPPMWKTGSLNDQIQIQEVLRFTQYQTNQSQTMAGIAYMSASQLTSMQAIGTVYSQSPVVGFDIPMSTDNSDPVFGLQRLTHKSFVLRVVKSLEFPTAQFTITSQQATQRCGASIDQLRLNSRLYVEDFSTFSQWNDATQPQKYVPSSIAFYCYDPIQHVLLPIEIRLVDTQLVYTPFDSPNDWALAKMAVETASNNYHSVYHMIATHGTMIPIRVELVRTMAPNHPIRVLLERHSAYDFALERLAAVQLFNTSTLLDQTFGWGATGSIRFMNEIGQYRLSVRNTFIKDIQARGLDLFGADHKYVFYASKYWGVIQTFVEKYVKVYYPTNTEMTNDSELQRWAQNCAKIPQLRDFPSTLVCQNCLRDLLTHLIFTNTLTHHGMNGASTWMGMSAPYSPAALWKPLPTAKNTALNLMEYTIPVPLIPSYIALVGFFARPSPDSENFMNAYSVSPFKDEIALQTAINEFKQGLQAIEDTTVATEQGKPWPYMTLRPSRLPFTSWI